jgi:hypothetical protein
MRVLGLSATGTRKEQTLEAKRNASILLYLPFVILFILLLCPSNLILGKEADKGCVGKMHIHQETKMCIFDITYPILSNLELNCRVRKWIDEQRKEHGDGAELDPNMDRKNEFWITNEVYQSGDLESVVIENYQYDQGANGSTLIKTFTADVKTSMEFDLFDILDSKKDWFGALQPFINDLNENSSGMINITDDDVRSGYFKSSIVDKEELVILFDQEEVAPHSSGVVKLRIPLKKISSVLMPLFLKEKTD